MYFVILFDISNPKRLRKVAKLLSSHGVRVQNSVFEIKTSRKNLKSLTALLNDIIEGQVRVHYYQLCPKDITRRKADGLGNVLHIPDYACVL